MSQPWHYIAKLVCIGDSGTGKSSLTIRLCEGRFSPSHDVTIGVEFGSRIVNVGPSPSPDSPTPSTQKRMKLSLWDTAGQETYKSVTRSYFRGASGALLVYDISRRATFEHAKDWLSDLRAIADEGIVVVLVGNKSDLATTESSGGSPGREVSQEEAVEWARQNNILSAIETSAKSGEGVEEAFLEVARKIHANIELGQYDLNDRRSGVKGAAAGNASRTVKLGMNDAAAGKGGAWYAGGGNCC